MSVSRIVPNISTADPGGLEAGFYGRRSPARHRHGHGPGSSRLPHHPTDGPGQRRGIRKLGLNRTRISASRWPTSMLVMRGSQRQGYSIVYPLTDEPWAFDGFLSGTRMGPSSMS